MVMHIVRSSVRDLYRSALGRGLASFMHRAAEVVDRFLLEKGNRYFQINGHFFFRYQLSNF